MSPDRSRDTTTTTTSCSISSFAKHFEGFDLICGGFLHIAKHAPDYLCGKAILTNTTTEENVDRLSGTGAVRLITTTPHFDGRSFATNLTEAVITAAVGSDRRLTIDEMNAAIDDLGIRPSVTTF